MAEALKLPSEFQQLLDQARAEVLAHRDNDLPRPTRLRLQLALGPHLESPNKPPFAIPGVGLTRRTNLCVSVVEQVAPIWDRHYPDIPAVEDMLRFARQRLREECTHDEALNGRSRLVGALLNHITEPEEKQPGIAAGEAAQRLVHTAVYDENFEDPALLDEHFDPTAWDCAFWGACAWSGSIPRLEGWNQEAYKEYWLWYLNEAIPWAWASVPEPGPLSSPL